MLRIFLFSALLVVAMVAGLAFVIDTNDDQKEGLLMVQRAVSGSVTPTNDDRFTLVMEDTRHVAWFSDRPERSAGTMDLAQFVALFQSDDFSEDPPNAALEADGVLYAMELLSVSLDGATGTLTYEVRALDESNRETDFEQGNLQSLQFGPASLFIDPSEAQILGEYDV